jgi:hypothetical protein
MLAPAAASTRDRMQNFGSRCCAPIEAQRTFEALAGKGAARFRPDLAPLPP